MKVQKGGVILVAPDGEDINQFKHQTRSKERNGKSPTKFLSTINSPCRVCPKKVTDENSLTCDKCEGWVHFKCSKLTKHEFDFLCNSPKTRLKHFCPTCETSSPSVTGSDPVLVQEARLDALDKKFDTVEMQNKAILELLKKEDKKEEVVDVDVMQVTVQQVLDNSKEKEEKKNNLIMFNLPETATTDAKQSYEEDLQKVKDVLRYVNGGTLIQDLDESNVSRMGRRKEEQTRPRGIKIQLANNENKMKILRNAKELAKHATFKTLGLSPDKTQQERTNYLKMRTEVNTRNAKGEDLIIYKDKIITRAERPTFNKSAEPAKGTDKVSDVSATKPSDEETTSPTANAEAGNPPGTPLTSSD